MFSTQTQDIVSLLLLSCFMFFLSLGSGYLFDEDEPKNAECGREMFVRSDWVVPTYNEELRTDKPIMLYWLMLASFSVWGVSEFGARFPSACMAVATILMVYQMGSRLFDRKAGWIAACCLSSSLMYVVIGRVSTPDSTLIAFTTLALLLYVKLTPAATWNAPESAQQHWRDEQWGVPTKWLQFAGLYCVMGLGVLTKGPVGFLLPCTIIGLFLLVNSVARTQMAKSTPSEGWIGWVSHYGMLTLQTFAPQRFIGALVSMRPLTLAACVCIVALPWYIAVAVATDGAWIEGFLGKHNVGRFTSSMEGHSGPFFYYVPVIMMGFFPWSLGLPAMLMQLWNQTQRSSHHYSIRFLCCWVGIYLTFFSIAQTKLPNYILPCYPALALLMGQFIAHWLQQKQEVIEKWPRLVMGWLIACGIVVLVALPVAALFVLPEHMLIVALAGIPATVGGLIGYLYLNEKRSLYYCWTGVATSMCLVVFGVVAPTVSQSQESVLLGEKARLYTNGKGQVATYDYFAPNLPFYAEQQVYRLHDIETLTEFWTNEMNSIVLIRSDHFPKLSEQIPFELEVVDQQRRFLRRHDVYLVTRKSRDEMGNSVASEKTSQLR